MAENRLPRALNKLLAHADLQVAACRKWQDTLALCRVRAADLEHAATAARATEAELRAAHAAWSDARSERRRIDHESWDFIALTRLSLAPHLGERWSAHWAVVGFTRPTLRVPEKFTARQHILMFLTMAFALHPEWEAAEAGFTAERAGSVRDALTGAEGCLQSASTRLYAARKARNAAVATLNGTLRRLMKELHAALPPADALWLAFDLKPPIRQRRKCKTQSAVVIAEASPAAAGPCSDELNTGTADGPETDEFSRVQPVMGMVSVPAHGARRMTAEEGGENAREAYLVPENSWWSRLRDGARKIRWNLF